MNFSFDVTKEDIENGCPKSRNRCPIALCLKRYFPKAFSIDVCNYHDIQSGSWWSCRISFMKAGFHFDLNKEHSEKASAFDRGDTIDPFTMEIEL